MTKPYFKQVPDFQYINLNKNNNIIGDYTTVKNFFKRGQLRKDILQNLFYFEKYKIIGDERPDNIALKFYGSESLDWVVFLSNNIIDPKTEWPLSNESFNTYLIDKYQNEETIYGGIHHYETIEYQNLLGYVVLKPGIKVQEEFTFTYYDEILSNYVTPPSNSIVRSISNYEYETSLEEKKRNIYLLKSIYLNTVFNDLDKIMPYKEGSEQYVSRTLKKANNINLYS